MLRCEIATLQASVDYYKQFLETVNTGHESRYAIATKELEQLKEEQQNASIQLNACREEIERVMQGWRTSDRRCAELQQQYDAAMTLNDKLAQRVTTMCDRLRAIIAVEKEGDPKLVMALSFILLGNDYGQEKEKLKSTDHAP